MKAQTQRPSQPVSHLEFFGIVGVKYGDGTTEELQSPSGKKWIGTIRLDGGLRVWQHCGASPGALSRSEVRWTPGNSICKEFDSGGAFAKQLADAEFVVQVRHGTLSKKTERFDSQQVPHPSTFPLTQAHEKGICYVKVHIDDCKKVKDYSEVAMSSFLYGRAQYSPNTAAQQYVAEQLRLILLEREAGMALLKNQQGCWVTFEHVKDRFLVLHIMPPNTEGQFDYRTTMAPGARITLRDPSFFTEKKAYYWPTARVTHPKVYLRPGSPRAGLSRDGLSNS
jgi:hypothetical protein